MSADKILNGKRINTDNIIFYPVNEWAATGFGDPILKISRSFMTVRILIFGIEKGMINWDRFCMTFPGFISAPLVRH
jgi:hypothetical protein